MSSEPDLVPDTLTERLRIFHPDYRGLMLGLVIIGFIAAGLMFLSLELIKAIVQSFSSAGGRIPLPNNEPFHLIVETLSGPGWFGTGGLLVVAVLIGYALVELSGAVLRFVTIKVEARLEIRSKNHIEQTLLANLLRKDDKFFLTHSAAEIANRLNVDTRDIIQRRKTVTSLLTTVMLAGAILFSLASADPLYAVVAVVFSSVGVVVMHYMLGEMEYLRKEQFESDDSIKATFEDYLGAAPEIQVGNLYDKVLRRVRAVQDRRFAAFMRTTVLNGRLASIYTVNQLVAFLAILGAIAWTLFHGEGASVNGLVAAVIAAVPRLYGNISDLARIFMELRLSKVSVKRLEEYAADELIGTEPMKALPPPGAPAAITVDKIKYAYTRGEQPRGGADGISLTIEPNSLNVIVGPAGSGKSTLAQLIMGRMKPMSGRISMGETELTGLGPSQRSGIFSYMPQSLIVVDGTLEENIRFGIPTARQTPDEQLDAAAMSWVDRTTVSTLARERALEMKPVDKDLGRYNDGIAELRAALRERVEREANIPVMPFDPTSVVPRLTVLENLTTSAVDMELLFRMSRSREHEMALNRLSEMPQSAQVVEFARNVFAQTSQMLQRCPMYDAYAGLAPFPITPMVWEFRTRLLRQGPLDKPDPKTRMDLLFAGLTASPPEGDGTASKTLVDFLRESDGSPFADAVSKMFGKALTPLASDQLNANMSWRDNLLFGVARIANAKAAAEVNRVILEEVAGKAVDPPILRSGLRYHVGRQGKRLSGGQRQLVCLCRTFLQGHPIIIVDEPTAALDPKNRAAVNALLREAASERTIIAITHDVDLAKQADTVIMMKDGRLWASGTFDTLVEKTPEFRQMINMREEARL
jgi:ABC-type multidrug transport system fused ATPase/permease subunit